ncbi:MAG: hypothetical protein KDE03_17325 [Rhodobacteraceae bacterium]|nr:hypothetical protein [Paracoccaceae bacterium]
MAYKIDPVADWPVVEEFRKTPVGRHSPNLMRVLNTLRFDPSGWQTILVVRVQFQEWVLATMPPDRADPVQLHENRVFTSREDAEWAVFCERWKAHTGIEIATDRHTPLPEKITC